MTNIPNLAPTPLRVAIIGSGPSAFYAADHLQKSGLPIEIDMFERLPTPYGLVRGGVAPDHPKIKTVTAVYEKIALRAGFRFFGNVTFGVDVTHADLRQHYHAIIYGVGAQTDRRMGIPGEELSGSHAATEFVGWYNAHPDYRDLSFDLTQQAVAVIGNGNVAMDVARILASNHEELAQTDIADYALEALTHSHVTDIYVIGRRGIAQAAFTNPELKELGELADADVVVRPQDAELDPLSRTFIMEVNDRNAERNVQTLLRYQADGIQGKRKRIHMRFLEAPVQLIGTEHVEAIEIMRNELVQADDGSLRPRATGQSEILPVGLVFRSIGYRGVALPDVPFDERKGVIPNESGRVITTAGALTGEYVVGWIKRGPSGIIGTNKPDAQATVDLLIADAQMGGLTQPEHDASAAIPQLLHARGVRYVTFADWQRLDALEQQRGAQQQRPRIKFSRVDEMLAVIEHGISDPAGD